MSKAGTSIDLKEKLKSMRVLFLDDEENVLRALQRILRHEPYQLIFESSPSSALNQIKSQTIHLVVSDQRMPEMSGVEFLEEVRKISPDTIRMMLTGYGDLKTAEESINRVEIYRFLTKPWNDEDLKATISQALFKWILQDENRRMVQLIEEQNRKLREFNQELEQKVEERTRQLKEAEALLVQSEKMATIGLLAGGIAHELNNPLAGILALTQLLETEIKDEQILEDLRTIEKAVHQCKTIIDNLLKFSRRNPTPKLEPINIPTLVQSTLTLIGYLFRNSNIRVVQDYEPDLPVLMANPTQIQQVLINLLTNAYQAMNKPGTITIRARRNGNHSLILEVEDQGVGIPKELQAKIFDPFFTTKEPGKGTGLGLFICSGIIRDHQGRIEVESEPGAGTCMRLIFKLEEDLTRALGSTVACASSIC